MSRWEWFGGALVIGAIGLIIAGAPSERKAAELITRLGGRYKIEPRFGLDCLGVIVQIDLSECEPTVRDLAELKPLRHLRLLDLSRTPIGDRELVQLVDSPCPFIVVPDGQTSDKVRSMFPEEQIGLGIGISEFALPGTTPFSLPAEASRERTNLNRAAEPMVVKRTPARAKRRPASGKARTAAAKSAFAASWL